MRVLLASTESPCRDSVIQQQKVVALAVAVVVAVVVTKLNSYFYPEKKHPAYANSVLILLLREIQVPW